MKKILQYIFPTLSFYISQINLKRKEISNIFSENNQLINDESIKLDNDLTVDMELLTHKLNENRNKIERINIDVYTYMDAITGKLMQVILVFFCLRCLLNLFL